MTQLVAKLLVANRLSRLPSKTPDLAIDFGYYVRDAIQIRFYMGKLVEGLFSLGFVLRYSRRLFKYRSAFLRFGRENLVNLTLGHDRIGSPTNTCIHEKPLNVL